MSGLMRRKTILLALLCIHGVLAPAPALAESDEVRIGAILPLSGNLAGLGAKLRAGISMAAADAGGGVRIEWQDGAFDKKQALSAYEKLTMLDRVRLIVGPLGPDQTLVLAPPARKAGVLLIAIAMCDKRFLEYPNVFCIFPKSEAQIAPLLRLLAEQSAKRAAYLGEELQGFEDYRRLLGEALAEAAFPPARGYGIRM